MEIPINDAGLSGAIYSFEYFDVGNKNIFIDSRPQIVENSHNKFLDGLCLNKYSFYFFKVLIMRMLELLSNFSECYPFILRLKLKMNVYILFPSTYMTFQKGDL